jgi:RNA polymerase sigma-70 factor (ECF subfamily)
MQDSMDLLVLFEEHHAPLFRFAYRLTGSVADAEDIVQECFLALLGPARSHDSRRTPVQMYPFGAVRNQSLKRLRDRQRTAEDSGSGADARSPETEVLRTEISEVVARAVMQLPELQPEVLIHARYEPMPLAEIARILDIESTAVKSRLQRARANMKETLAAYAPGAEQRPWTISNSTNYTPSLRAGLRSQPAGR